MSSQAPTCSARTGPSSASHSGRTCPSSAVINRETNVVYLHFPEQRQRLVAKATTGSGTASCPMLLSATPRQPARHRATLPAAPASISLRNFQESVRKNRRMVGCKRCSLSPACERVLTINVTRTLRTYFAGRNVEANALTAAGPFESRFFGYFAAGRYTKIIR
mgnify:CR=1 FL=1